MAARQLLRRAKMRLQHLRYRTAEVDRSAYLAFGSALSPDIRVGAYSYIGPRCQICPRVEIGRYVMLASDVMIVGSDHNYDVPGTPIIFSGRPPHPRTLIGDDVWIASRATIFAGTRIGRGAIVGAGALVTKDVEDYAIVAGVPATLVRHRFDPEQRRAHDAMLDEPAREGAYAETLR
jgi:acetyltransferase-like isoleucine patch superfamily enzyme